MKKLAHVYATVKMDPPLNREVEDVEEVVEEVGLEAEMGMMVMNPSKEMVETVREVAKNQSFQLETSTKIPDKEEIVEVEEDSGDEVDFEEGVVVIEVEDVVDSEEEGASEDN